MTLIFGLEVKVMQHNVIEFLMTSSIDLYSNYKLFVKICFSSCICNMMIDITSLIRFGSQRYIITFVSIIVKSYYSYSYAQAGELAGHWHAAAHCLPPGISPLPTTPPHSSRLPRRQHPSAAPLITAYQMRLRSSPKVHLFCDVVRKNASVMLDWFTQVSFLHEFFTTMACTQSPTF